MLTQIVKFVMIVLSQLAVADGSTLTTNVVADGSAHADCEVR